MRAAADWPDVEWIVSFAGRTAAPDLPVAMRTGGFGGASGLAAYLRDERIAVLVDATHPFAAQMSRNAWEAHRQSGIPLIRLTRGGWTPEPADRWQEVADMQAAAAALGTPPRRVFLTIGRQALAAFAAASQHFYIVRSIERPAPDHGLTQATFLQARGPFPADEEERLMRDQGIDVLVTKNSGGAASAGKLLAARRLAMPVIMVRRPAEPGAATDSVAEALGSIRAHLGPPTARGV